MTNSFNRTLRSLVIVAVMTNILNSFFQVSAAKTSSKATPTPKTHTVNVGSGGSFMYNPSTIVADVGDIIMFEFAPTNHSVVRGEYTESKACGQGGCNPCVPYELIHPGEAGFNSRNILTQTLPTESNPGVTFNITINDTSPIWFYCTALTSCTPNGMVGVINPANGTSLDKQHDAAVNAPFQLSPGQPWPAEGVAPGAETAPATYNSSAHSATTHEHHLSGGAIAGIVIAAIAVTCLGAALFYFVGRSKTYKDILKQSEVAGNASSSGAPENLGTFSPAMQTPNVVSGQWDHRFSGQTAYSNLPQHPVEGTFLGYNRQTGAPEFAAEVPISEKRETLPAGHPAFGSASNQETTYELAGEAPAAAEVGHYK